MCSAGYRDSLSGSCFLPTLFGTVIDNFLLLLTPSLFAKTDTKTLVLLWAGISASIGGIFFLQK